RGPGVAGRVDPGVVTGDRGGTEHQVALHRQVGHLDAAGQRDEVRPRDASPARRVEHVVEAAVVAALHQVDRVLRGRLGAGRRLVAGGERRNDGEGADAQAQQQGDAADHQADDQAGAALAWRGRRRERRTAGELTVLRRTVRTRLRAAVRTRLGAVRTAVRTRLRIRIRWPVLRRRRAVLGLAVLGLLPVRIARVPAWLLGRIRTVRRVGHARVGTPTAPSFVVRYRDRRRYRCPEN